MTQVAQRFGGGWTRQKLDVVENYLVAYTRVMQKQTNSGLGTSTASRDRGSLTSLGSSLWNRCCLATTA